MKISHVDSIKIVFDGNCTLCTRGATMLYRYGKLTTATLLPYEDLDNESRTKIDASRFRTEMAIIDPATGRVLYGMEGIIFAAGKHFTLLRKIKKDSQLFCFLQFIYRIIALNRYIIFTPRSLFKCECEPPFSLRERMALILLTVLFALGVSAAFAAVIAKRTMFPFYYVLLAVGGGWVLQILIAHILIEKETRYDYIAHLGIIMAVGVLILVPVITLGHCTSTWFLPAAGLSVLVSFITMSAMHLHRIKHVGLGKKWHVGWLLSLLCSVAISLLIYFQNH